MALILPAILVDSYQHFRERLHVLPPEAETVSIDIMDGTFVEPHSWHNVEELADTHVEPFFELDLMVNDPLPIITEWAGHPHTIRAIVQAEIEEDMRPLLEEIRALDLEVGLALLPSTPLEHIEHLLNACDMVLIRGNEPGYAGQELLSSTPERVATLRAFDPHLPINVDIGVSLETIPALVQAGATHLCVNTALFSAQNPKEAFHELQALAETSPVDTPLQVD